MASVKADALRGELVEVGGGILAVAVGRKAFNTQVIRHQKNDVRLAAFFGG